MNGRLYDPLVGRMLSPDIVIQNPEYSQSYNRYSYCFNNPLRFTDPSGYVVTIPPEYLKMLEYASDINKYEKEIAEIGIDLESISYNTEELEGSIRTTVSWTINEDNYRLESVKFLYDNYKQKYATSCIASSLCAIERRSNSCDFNEEEIMNIQKDSYKNGLNLDNALQYYVNKSKIFSQYTKHKISDIDNYEKYLFQEMYHMNRPTSLLVQNKNWIFNHFVNTYNVTKLYINDIDNDFDINIWDSANDGTSDIKNINSFDNVLYMILYGEK